MSGADRGLALVRIPKHPKNRIESSSEFNSDYMENRSIRQINIGMINLEFLNIRNQRNDVFNYFPQPSAKVWLKPTLSLTNGWGIHLRMQNHSNALVPSCRPPQHRRAKALAMKRRGTFYP